MNDTMDYLAMKKNEVVIQAKTWVKLENIMVRERNQSQKAAYCMAAIIGMYRRVRPIDT